MHIYLLVTGPGLSISVAFLAALVGGVLCSTSTCCFAFFLPTVGLLFLVLFLYNFGNTKVA